MKKRIIKCQTCGKEKEVVRYWAKFCSAKCRLIAWAKEHKPVIIEGQHKFYNDIN